MKNYILILLSWFLVSCSFNKTYENREADKEEAEKVTNSFYSLIQQNKKNELFGLLMINFLKKKKKLFSNGKD